MYLYYLIFLNSLQAYILTSVRSETAWFAAQQFGGYNMAFATIAAFFGSVIGRAFGYALGYYISSCLHEHWFLSEKAYQRISRIFNRYLVWALFVPQIPIVETYFRLGSLFGLIHVLVGAFGVPPKRALAIIALGRVLYYWFNLSILQMQT